MVNILCSNVVLDEELLAKVFGEDWLYCGLRV